MNPDRLTGFVYPVKKNGVPARGRWQLWVNLPPEPAFATRFAPPPHSPGLVANQLMTAYAAPAAAIRMGKAASVSRRSRLDASTATATTPAAIMVHPDHA